MSTHQFSVSRTAESALEINKVLRNTYLLLSMTLLFSAVTAALSVAVNTSFMVSLACSFGALGLIWLVLPRTAESAAGIGVVFAITGLLGFGLGPVLNHYLALSNGGQLVGVALGGTGAVFLGLSGYALTTKRDFSFMGSFLIVGFMVVLVAALANIFMQIPALSLAISSAVIFIMSGFILYDTSRIVNGGERNYVLATVSMYLSIYNIFTSLLHLLGAFGGDE